MENMKIEPVSDTEAEYGSGNETDPAIMERGPAMEDIGNFVEDIRDNAVKQMKETLYERMDLCEARNRNLARRVADLEEMMDNFLKEERRAATGEKELMEYVENGVEDAGKYGASRAYIRRYLKEKHGISTSGYQRTKVNRAIRSMIDTGIVEERGTLLIVKKD